MKIEFIDVKYNKEIKLDKKIIDNLKKYKLVVIYTTVQFINNLSSIAKQLKDSGIKVIISKPSRVSREGQILGCDVYHGNLNLPVENSVDACLFIGDGEFHPIALLYSGISEVINYNPLNNKLKIYDKKDIDKVLKKRNANIKRFLIANIIGIIISTKYGQEQPHYVKLLKNKFKDKKFYVFVADNINFQDLENFPFIQAWLNTACPRIGLENALNAGKAIVNVEDVLE